MHLHATKKSSIVWLHGPGDSLYARLSVMAQYYCSANLVFIVWPESFDPASKVDSAIVRMTPHKNPVLIRYDIKKLWKTWLETAFTTSKKTLRKQL